jgi:hypothetical protein
LQCRNDWVLNWGCRVYGHALFPIMNIEGSPSWG